MGIKIHTESIKYDSTLKQTLNIYQSKNWQLKLTCEATILTNQIYAMKPLINFQNSLIMAYECRRQSETIRLFIFKLPPKTRKMKTISILNKEHSLFFKQVWINEKQLTIWKKRHFSVTNSCFNSWWQATIFQDF